MFNSRCLPEPALHAPERRSSFVSDSTLPVLALMLFVAIFIGAQMLYERLVPIALAIWAAAAALAGVTLNYLALGGSDPDWSALPPSIYDLPYVVALVLMACSMVITIVRKFDLMSIFATKDLTSIKVESKPADSAGHGLLRMAPRSNREPIEPDLFENGNPFAPESRDQNKIKY